MSYSKFLNRFCIPIVLVSLAIFALCAHYVVKLKVKSDFKEMLPESAPSVIELNRIEKRVKSTDNLIILVGGTGGWPAIKAFVDEFAQRLKDELGPDLSRIEYNVNKIKDYYEHNKYLYIDLVDLKEIYDRLKTRIDWEKLKRTPLFVQIAEEEPGFTTADIEEKYKSKGGRYTNYQDGYLTDNEADVTAIMVWPSEPATNVEFSQKFIDRIKSIAAGMPGFKPPLKMSFEGRIKRMIREYRAVMGDVVKTTLLCFAFVGLVVFLYFRKVRMGLLMLINVAQGTLAALAIAYFLIGYLTSQTAFLGSIIVGNGINYSLIFMARYLEEKRERNASAIDALTIAVTRTWRPTLVAAVVTSAAFVALMVTHVRGINQFGIIGGIGMVLCWICTYTIMPAWLSLFEKIWETKVKPHATSQLLEKFSHFVVAKPAAILKGSVVLTVVCLGIMAFYLPNSLEYDFSKLSFKSPPPEDPWEDYARHRMDDEIFGESTSPSVVILDRAEQGLEYCDAILAKDPERRYIESCKTMYSFVPKEQKEKLEVLADMRELLSSSTLKFLDAKQLEEVDKFKKTFDLQPVTIEDVPNEITDTFSDIDGNRGMLAFVYPKADLWNGRELQKFADMLREVKLPGGDVIKASGQPVILSDLLNAVVEQAPKMTVLSFLLVLILIWINFINWRHVSVIQMTLLAGIVWLIGLMGVWGIKLNFLNFVALPITFGIGVDYAVNIYQRYRQEGPGSIGTVIAKTGGAVALCSATTIIGYSVILTSRSRALVSFGLVALLGEFTCLAAALISLPAYIKWKESRIVNRKP